MVDRLWTRNGKSNKKVSEGGSTREKSTLPELISSPT